MKLNVDKNLLWISGKLVKLKYGKLENYVNGKPKYSEKEYYQFSVLTPEDPGTAEAVRANYYASADAQFTPRWITGEEKPDEKGMIFVNYKSLYDVKYFIPDREGDNALSFDDVRERYGSLVGSTVTLSITCKEGALYVAAVRVDDLKTVSVNDYFA